MQNSYEKGPAIRSGPSLALINEDKSRTIDLTKGGSFAFLGFEYRLVLSRNQKSRPQFVPKMKKRTALFAKLREVFRQHVSRRVSLTRPRELNMKGIVVGVGFVLTAQLLVAQTAPRVPLGIVSDWTHRHVLYPHSKDSSAMAEIRRDPRWAQNWYLRHREAWWPAHHRGPGKSSRRD
jgi:hypothetical protein